MNIDERERDDYCFSDDQNLKNKNKTLENGNNKNTNEDTFNTYPNYH